MDPESSNRIKAATERPAQANSLYATHWFHNLPNLPAATLRIPGYRIDQVALICMRALAELAGAEEGILDLNDGTPICVFKEQPKFLTGLEKHQLKVIGVEDLSRQFEIFARAAGEFLPVRQTLFRLDETEKGRPVLFAERMFLEWLKNDGQSFQPEMQNYLAWSRTKRFEDPDFPQQIKYYEQQLSRMCEHYRHHKYGKATVARDYLDAEKIVAAYEVSEPTVLALMGSFVERHGEIENHKALEFVSGVLKSIRAAAIKDDPRLIRNSQPVRVLEALLSYDQNGRFAKMVEIAGSADTLVEVARAIPTQIPFSDIGAALEHMLCRIAQRPSALGEFRELSNIQQFAPASRAKVNVGRNDNEFVSAVRHKTFREPKGDPLSQLFMEMPSFVAPNAGFKGVEFRAKQHELIILEPKLGRVYLSGRLLNVNAEIGLPLISALQAWGAVQLTHSSPSFLARDVAAAAEALRAIDAWQVQGLPKSNYRSEAISWLESQGNAGDRLAGVFGRFLGGIKPISKGAIKQEGDLLTIDYSIWYSDDPDCSQKIVADGTLVKIGENISQTKWKRSWDKAVKAVIRSSALAELICTTRSLVSIHAKELVAILAQKNIVDWEVVKRESASPFAPETRTFLGAVGYDPGRSEYAGKESLYQDRLIANAMCSYLLRSHRFDILPIIRAIGPELAAIILPPLIVGDRARQSNGIADLHDGSTRFDNLTQLRLRLVSSPDKHLAQLLPQLRFIQLIFGSEVLNEMAKHIPLADFLTVVAATDSARRQFLNARESSANHTSINRPGAVPFVGEKRLTYAKSQIHETDLGAFIAAIETWKRGAGIEGRYEASDPTAQDVQLRQSYLTALSIAVRNNAHFFEGIVASGPAGLLTLQQASDYLAIGEHFQATIDMGPAVRTSIVSSIEHGLASGTKSKALQLLASQALATSPQFDDIWSELVADKSQPQSLRTLSWRYLVSCSDPNTIAHSVESLPLFIKSTKADGDAFPLGPELLDLLERGRTVGQDTGFNSAWYNLLTVCTEQTVGELKLVRNRLSEAGDSMPAPEREQCVTAAQDASARLRRLAAVYDSLELGEALQFPLIRAEHLDTVIAEGGSKKLVLKCLAIDGARTANAFARLPLSQAVRQIAFLAKDSKLGQSLFEELEHVDPSLVKRVRQRVAWEGAVRQFGKIKLTSTIPPQFVDNHYALLGLPVNATDSEIKLNYRILVSDLHPDRNLSETENATVAFRRVQESYEVLSDPAARARFDSERPRNPDLYPQANIFQS